MVSPRWLAAVGIAALAAFGAGAQPVPPGAEAAPVAVSLRLDKKVYGQKDPIKLTFVAKNTSKSPVKLSFMSTMQSDFEIHKGKTASGEKVWQWSKGRMFGMIVTQPTLDPGKQLTFNETFTPGENGPDGKPVPTLAPGAYTATAVLTTGGRAPRPMAQTLFTVKN